MTLWRFPVGERTLNGFEVVAVCRLHGAAVVADGIDVSGASPEALLELWRLGFTPPPEPVKPNVQ